MKHRTRWLSGVAAASLLAVPLIAGAGSQAIQVPVSVWLDAQPLNVVTAWHDPVTHRDLRLDGFGTRAAAFGITGLGTTFEGNVTARVLGDGRARVSVLLHTKNAICWGYQGDASETEESYLAAFGYAPSLVAEGAPPSLGEGVFRIEFLVPWPTNRMPTYYEIQPGDPIYPRLSLSHVISCSGALRPASGYPDGTPGIARTTQVGLWFTGRPGGCPPEADANCYPSERITWWPVAPR